MVLVKEGTGGNFDAGHGMHILLGPGRLAQVAAVGAILAIVYGGMEDVGARILHHHRQAASCLQIVRAERRSGVVQDRVTI